MGTSSRISTLYKPGYSSLVFSISSTEELLNEKDIRACYELVSSLLVAVTTQQSSLCTSNGGQGEVREPRRTMDKEVIQSIRQVISRGQVQLEPLRIQSPLEIVG